VSAHRGELWLIDFGEPVGREQSGTRPALVVSANALNDGPAGVVIVVPLTTVHRDLPTHVEIDDDESSGLDEVSYAKCEDIKSVSELRLITRLGVANEQAMFSVARALRFLIDL
jgi:mRNA interferase MazF